MVNALVAVAKGEPAQRVDVEVGAPGNDEVLIDVTHSSINYKDAIALLGLPGIVRRWPLALGIDAVGTVRESPSGAFRPGDRVILNGAGAGETRDGGYAARMRAPVDSVVGVPESISLPQAAAIGTAGFTAAIAVLAIEDHGLTPGDGTVLVTGAAGGVGSIAISLLAGRGHTVVASSGRAEQEHDYLTDLGAARIIERNELSVPDGAALQERRWSAVVDGVGSHTLVNAIAQTRYGGIAVSYGLAQGPDLPGTVLPFILRAVTLAGANSVDAPLSMRKRAWALLGAELDLSALGRMSTAVGLDDVLPLAERVLRGQVRGRTVVDLTR